MGFITDLRIQLDSQKLAIAQNKFISRTQKAGKVTAKDVKEQVRLLKWRKKLIDRLKAMQEKEPSMIYKETASRLLLVQETMYAEAMSQFAKFKADFHLENGAYIPNDA